MEDCSSPSSTYVIRLVLSHFSYYYLSSVIDPVRPFRIDSATGTRLDSVSPLAAFLILLCKVRPLVRVLDFTLSGLRWTTSGEWGRSLEGKVEVHLQDPDLLLPLSPIQT